MQIGHITDLHLRENQPGTSRVARRLSRKMLPMLPDALERMRQAGADCIVITGDLLDVPDEVLADTRPDARAVAAAVNDYARIRELLETLKLPYLVLPGNHDLEQAMWDVFDPSQNELAIAGHRLLRFCDREGENHIPRRVGVERERWHQALRSVDGLPQVHLQHYVITPELNAGYPHTYGDGDLIRQANTASGRCVLCLSGHYHAGTEVIGAGSCAFTTGPAFCEPPHPLRLYDLNSTGLTVRTILMGSQS